MWWANTVEGAEGGRGQGLALMLYRGTVETQDKFDNTASIASVVVGWQLGAADSWLRLLALGSGGMCLTIWQLGAAVGAGTSSITVFTAPLNTLP